MTQKKTTAARKRPATTRKRKTNRKKKGTATWLHERGPQLVGLVITLIILLAIGKVGLIGKLLANGWRWLLGDAYQFALVLLLIPLLVVVAYGKWPKRFKAHVYVGLLLAGVGVLLVNTILLFTKLDMHTHMVAKIGVLINQDILNQSTQTPVGGGVLGAFLYQGIYTLLGNMGAWLVAVLCIIFGLVTLFKLPVREVFDNLFNLAEGTGDFVQAQAVSVHESVTEKVASFKERQQAAMQDVFKDDPFGASDTNETEKPAKATASNVVPTTLPDKQADLDSLAATASEFQMPEIIAPKPHHEAEKASLAVAPTVTQTVDQQASPDQLQAQTNQFDPEGVVQAEQEKVSPVTYGVELDDDVDPAQAVLTHADILGHQADEKPSQQAKTTNVGHVEPSTISEPTEDVDASGLATVVDDRHYQLPSTQLLTQVTSTDQSAERDALNEKARILHETLKSFHINATVEKVVLGPTVTQYEIKPAVGVKVSKILNLADDLALSLAAKSLRIEAPIPGKNVVGIEVANDQQAVVGFRDMVEEAGADVKHPLVVPIGRGVTSGVVKMDLTKMPHLLIAGSTGSGKSVAINGILASILLQAKPSQVRLMLVDPKKVELSVYNDIPHLITPVVSDPKKAALGLKKVVAEMDRRFKLLAQEGVRNIDGYNRWVERQMKKDPHTVLQKMPYLVVVIDELADLMMTSAVSNDVENAIVRIAQLGRAAGIHMIVATQRPSVDIITGLIKANVPSRMAFAVSSGVDSRTILDTNGAEKLLGRGDMLFAPIGASGPQRVQGAFISDEDVENLTDFIKDQAEAQYDESMTVSDEEVKHLDQGNDDVDSLDELWDDVLVFILRANGASTSSIQRHFKIGYNRAGRIMDDLTDRGLIGGPNGSKPREIHFTAEMLPTLQQAAQSQDASKLN